MRIGRRVHVNCRETPEFLLEPLISLEPEEDSVLDVMVFGITMEEVRNYYLGWG